MYKIFEVVPFLNDGGAESLVKDYALLLDKEKFDVKIISILNKKNTANYQILKKNNIEIIPIFKNENLIVKIFRKIFGKRYICSKLGKIIQKENPDVIHIHMNLLVYFACLSNKLRNVKLFYTCHSLPSVYFSGKRRKEFEAACKLVKLNDLKFIALHEEMKNEIDRMFNVNNSIVLNNGIDFKRFKNQKESKEQIRKEIGIPDDSFVIGHIGRFVEAKNHKFLINIFEKILIEKENACLLLIGDGPLFGEIEKIIQKKGLQDKIIHLSHRTDVPKLLKAMDIFVFPSLWEGFGIVIVEALVSGLRCIVSNKVPEAAYLSENVVPLSLDDDISKWVETILDDTVKSDYSNNLYKYDILYSINKLEKLYTE